MEITLKTVAKREIVTAAEGTVLGKPIDFLIDPATHRVAAILLARARAEEASIVIPAEAVHSFGSDTLAIDGLSALELAFKSPAMLDLLEHGFRMRGRRVIADDGRKVGTIVRITIDERGTVLAYGVKRGRWGWFRRTRSVDPKQVGTSGGDVAILKALPAEPPPDRTLPTEPPGTTGAGSEGGETGGRPS